MAKIGKNAHQKSGIYAKCITLFQLYICEKLKL
jgi:hypothetical protein